MQLPGQLQFASCTNEFGQQLTGLGLKLGELTRKYAGHENLGLELL